MALYELSDEIKKQILYGLDLAQEAALSIVDGELYRTYKVAEDALSTPAPIGEALKVLEGMLMFDSSITLTESDDMFGVIMDSGSGEAHAPTLTQALIALAAEVKGLDT